MLRTFGTVVFLAGSIATPDLSSAAVARECSLVVHIDDSAAVPAPMLARAKDYVDGAFQDAGVRLEWVDGLSPVSTGVEGADPRGARHVSIFLINGPESPPGRPAAADVLGKAAHAAGRAHVFIDRVMAASESIPVDVGLVLATVVAHELGHLLLPPNSHSTTGVMRPKSVLRGPAVLRFTDAQAILIRTLLSRHVADR